MASPEWKVAWLHGPEGDTIARFRADRSAVVGDPRYPGALWVQIDPPEASDLDTLLTQLDTAEDQIAHLVELENQGCLLVALTGAGFRDLIFAVGVNGDSLVQAVAGCLCASGSSVQAQFYAEQRFGPFAKLVGTSA